MEYIKKEILIPILQNSKLANQFEDNIVIPKGYIMTEFKVIDNDSFQRTMETFRYFMVDKLPDEIYQYVYEHNPDLSNFKDFFFEELSTLSKKADIMDKCAENGYIGLMKFWYDRWLKINIRFIIDKDKNIDSYRLACHQERSKIFTSITAYKAAKNNHIECLKFIGRAASGLDLINCSTFCDAAKYGNLECFKWIHNYLVNYKCPCKEWGRKTCNHKKPSIFDGTMLAAINGGNLECVKYIFSRKNQLHPCYCKFAAKYDNLHILKYLHEIGCSWNEDTCSAAAECGNLDCLIYAHKNGCAIDKETCNKAAYGGNMYARESNHNFKPYNDCLRYALDNGVECDKTTCVHAASGGNLEALKMLHEHGCKMDKQSTYYALAFHSSKTISQPHIDCLNYELENGANWHENICVNLVRNGCLDLLKLVIDKGCPYDQSKLIKEAKKHCNDKMIEYVYCLSITGRIKYQAYKLKKYLSEQEDDDVCALY